MRIAQKILSLAYTLYLFTKSDTPLVVFPMVRSIKAHLFASSPLTTARGCDGSRCSD